MGEITYDDRSYMIDGQRIWLVSGSLHYFRIPRELWADRLLKAKRAGLNCISTYVAWNYHEPKEGQWEMDGEKDLPEFINLADDLDMYVILRPGPYICAEWDFGGFPAWLNAKSGVSYRTNNATFTHYFDKYFAQLLPRLSEHQVTHGGNIVLIQNENEYFMTTQPDRSTYLDFITQLFRRSGFTIPIITCNGMTEPFVDGAIECVNAYQTVDVQLRKLHSLQPHAPLLATEFWPGWFDHWGGEHASRDAKETARLAMQALGCGAQYNYYMFHGGTNFGFWGGRLSRHRDSFVTTSYDFDAPVTEGGSLSGKYYQTRLVNMLASSMGEYFATTLMDEPGASIRNASELLNLHGINCSWAIVSNHGRDDIESLNVTLPDGTALTAHLAPFGAAALPYELTLPDGGMLDYCSLTPLGLFGGEMGKVLVLHGPPQAEGVICISGNRQTLTVPKGDALEMLDISGQPVIVVNSELAMRTWVMDNSLVFGPIWGGKDQDDLLFQKSTKQYQVLDFEQVKLSTRKVKDSEVVGSKPSAPRLGNWKRLCICPEPIKKDLEWTSLDRPRDVDKLGEHYGYVWYRIDLDMQRETKKTLYIPHCADRASVYLNGELIHVWGHGEEASREPFPVKFKKGANVLVFLVDNLGRYKYGDRLGEPKGLYGHIWDAKNLKVSKFKLSQVETFSKRIVPRTLSHLMPTLEARPVWEAETSFQLKKVQSIHMTFKNIPHHVAVFCNDRPVEFFTASPNNWGDLTLGAELKKGKNVVKFVLWGDEVDAKVLDNVNFYQLNEPVSADGTWSWRHWERPEQGVGEPIKGKSCWYSSTFKVTDTETPLFLRIFGAKKGQLYLNGHDLGRFWMVGPQEVFYLPGCWLKTDEENELMVFEENGNMPSRSKLEYLPQGPYR
jgi:hypothetical protein